MDLSEKEYYNTKKITCFACFGPVLRLSPVLHIRSFWLFPFWCVIIRIKKLYLQFVRLAIWLPVPRRRSRFFCGNWQQWTVHSTNGGGVPRLKSLFFRLSKTVLLASIGSDGPSIFVVSGVYEKPGCLCWILSFPPTHPAAPLQHNCPYMPGQFQDNIWTNPGHIQDKKWKMARHIQDNIL